MEIKLILDRFEGDLAVLIGEDKLPVTWPRSKLPAGAKEGSAVTFYLMNDLERSEDDRRLAKNILNEILNP